MAPNELMQPPEIMPGGGALCAFGGPSSCDSLYYSEHFLEENLGLVFRHTRSCLLTLAGEGIHSPSVHLDISGVPVDDGNPRCGRRPPIRAGSNAHTFARFHDSDRSNYSVSRPAPVSSLAAECPRGGSRAELEVIVRADGSTHPRRGGLAALQHWSDGNRNLGNRNLIACEARVHWPPMDLWSLARIYRSGVGCDRLRRIDEQWLRASDAGNDGHSPTAGLRTPNPRQLGTWV